jgi:hypothetical protein
VLIHERLEAADFHTAGGKHARRDHTPCVTALIAEEARGSGLPIPLTPATAGDRPVMPELPASPALRAVSGREWPFRPAQGGLKYLHRRRRIATTPTRTIPSCRFEQRGVAAPAFSPTARSLPRPLPSARSFPAFRASPDHSRPVMISKSDSPDSTSIFRRSTTLRLSYPHDVASE